MPKFNVTYQTITPESAEDGDFADQGFYLENVSFREAFEAVQYCDMGHETDCYPANPHWVRWVTACQANHNFVTGETEDRAIHFPDSLTVSTKKRILNLFGIK